MTTELRAKPIIEAKIADLKAKSIQFSKRGLKPKLSVILVGNNPASLLYIENKKKRCQMIDADFELIQLDEDVTEDNFLAEVKKINSDPSVTGCFVQLPVPKHLEHINITQLINPLKDVDGFHLNTINQLYLNDMSGLIPCTPKGIVTLLKENSIEVQGKNIVIIGRSYIVGKPLFLIMNALNATVTLCHSKTQNIKEHTLQADIIICALGKAHFLTKEHINQEKNQVIIDVGINKLKDKTVGDVNFKEVSPLVQAITPVPGGVGPMTVFSLMENLIKTTENILKEGS